VKDHNFFYRALPPTFELARNPTHERLRKERQAREAIDLELKVKK